MMYVTRRFALQSSAGVLFLPDLMAREIERPVPKRAVFMAMGFGVNSTWFPEQRTDDLSLSSSLAPLQPFRDDISFVQNLSFMQRYNPHYASTIYLTGENIYRVPGSVQNSVSCDQMIAGLLADECRFPSLSLASDQSKDDYGHGAGVSSLSVGWSGRYVPGIRGPFSLFNYLFGKHSLDPEEIRQNLENKKSVLDYYHTEMKRAKSTIAASSQDILEEYADSVRDLEKHLSHAIKWSDIPYPKTKYPQPDTEPAATEEVKLTYDLMALALKYDLTRVITYALPTTSILTEMGAPISNHAMSHAPKSQTAHDRDLKNSELLAHFLKNLKQMETPDGKDLLYHTIASYGAGVRHGHGTRDVPMIIAGHGGGDFRQGQNVILPSHKTDVCDLWYTILRSFDASAQSFKTGRNQISEIVA